jgi:hypothetical protein
LRKRERMLKERDAMILAMRKENLALAIQNEEAG